MLLSIRYNFLFVHIAKTGGTSIRSALERYKWTDPYRLPQFLCSKLSGLTGHKLAIKIPRHAKAIAAKEMLPHELFHSLFKFAFVRNPWDLQVSSYHHIRRERPHIIEHINTFDEFLRWKLDPDRPYQYHIDTLSKPQSDYIVDLRGNVIVDFLGRHETLEADFAEACRRIGIKTPALPHKRKSSNRHRDYREYYDDDLAALVADRFKQDVDMFGYSFDDITRWK